MGRLVTTIIGLGIVTALFMAMMSMFYLEHIPTQADLDGLSVDIRRDHGLYLSPSATIDMLLVRPQEKGEKTGVRVTVVLRADIRQRPKSIELHMTRIADSILEHPSWRGKIAYVTVVHGASPPATVTRFAAAKADQKT